MEYKTCSRSRRCERSCSDILFTIYHSISNIRHGMTLEYMRDRDDRWCRAVQGRKKPRGGGRCCWHAFALRQRHDFRNGTAPLVGAEPGPYREAVPAKLAGWKDGRYASALKAAISPASFLFVASTSSGEDLVKRTTHTTTCSNLRNKETRSLLK
jgi:hypothetical protein